MSIKLFGFSTFYMVFGFLTHKKEKIDENNNVKIFNAKANKKPVDNSNNQQAHNQT